MGWIQALWIIVGSLGAIACVGASVFCFVTGHSGMGVGSLLLAPVHRGARGVSGRPGRHRLLDLHRALLLVGPIAISRSEDG